MIEIISIHLPKTGGSSFLKLLQTNFGFDFVLQYDRNPKLNKRNQKRQINSFLNENTKVLHGHLYYCEVEKLHKKATVKIVTWMRDPVDRVISNFLWWKNEVKTNPEHPERYRIDEALDLYITRKETQNKMYKSLKGLKLKDIYFLGFLESFDKDIQELANKLAWKEIPNFHEKNSANFTKEKPIVNNELREKIKKLNKKDISLYKKALKYKELG